jgi:ribose transport system substrate-binding protein
VSLIFNDKTKEDDEMLRSKTRLTGLTLVVMALVLTVIAAGCVVPAAAPQTVVETVVVKEEVEVVKTVEVEVPAAQACPTAKDSYKIGFANLTEDIVFTKLVRESIEKNTEAAGNIELVLADNKLDGATALANADSFILQGVDGVIEFQTDEKFGNVIMSKFRDEGIPVIAIDIPMPGATFFGADNYYAGRLAGEAAAEWVNENWDGQVDAILELGLPQSGPIPAARMQGMLEGLQENLANPVPEDAVFHLDSKNTQDEAFRVVSDVLPSIPDAEHIVGTAINDGTALGIIAALEAAGRKDQGIVIGQNADPSAREEMVKEEREESIYLGSTAYFPENYGDYLVPAIIDLLECRALPPSIYVDHILVTAENSCELYADDEWCE